MFDGLYIYSLPKGIKVLNLEHKELLQCVTTKLMKFS